MAKAPKAVSFKDALAKEAASNVDVKLPKERLGSKDDEKKRESASRFVETGEGLEIIRAGDKPKSGSDTTKAEEPKMVDIADLLLDELERQEDEEEARKAAAAKEGKE
jgi:hypothetical protein